MKCSSGLLTVIVLLIATPVFALAETNDRISVQGLDVTDLILVLTSALAIILGALSFIGYRHDGRTKLLFVTLAFFLFALKGAFIIGSDLLSLKQPDLDILASLLDFGVLLCFFAGIIKR